MGRKPGSGSLGLGRRRDGAPVSIMACLKTAVTDNLRQIRGPWPRRLETTVETTVERRGSICWGSPKSPPLLCDNRLQNCLLILQTRCIHTPEHRHPSMAAQLIRHNRRNARSFLLGMSLHLLIETRQKGAQNHRGVTPPIGAFVRNDRIPQQPEGVEDVGEGPDIIDPNVRLALQQKATPKPANPLNSHKRLNAMTQDNYGSTEQK